MSEPKVWIVAVDMGYGHQRAVYPLRKFAYGDIIVTANNYEGIPPEDRIIWEDDERFYNFISRFKSRGRLGRLAFNIFDHFQKIDEYYPIKKRTEPTLQLKSVYNRINRGWGRHLIRELAKRPVPLLTPFFTVAHMAEYWGYPGKIFVLVTDSDVSRAWAPMNPQKSKICYLAPTERVVGRLKEYGVLPERVFYTGFPLPEELVGADSRIARTNLKRRILALDPEGFYQEKFKPLIQSYMGKLKPRRGRVQPVNLAFAVGGAGAQAEIGCAATKSLAKLIRKNKVSLNLIAGVSEAAAHKFRDAVRKSDLESFFGERINVIFESNKSAYFKRFNQLLKNIDVLWTKPSELSFYAALGIPLIISPPVGSQEVQNREWLLSFGAGADQLNPKFTCEWLADWIQGGRLAEMALEGFVKMERRGVENIKKVLSYEE